MTYYLPWSAETSAKGVRGYSAAGQGRLIYVDHPEILPLRSLVRIVADNVLGTTSWEMQIPSRSRFPQILPRKAASLVHFQIRSSVLSMGYIVAASRWVNTPEVAPPRGFSFG